MSLNSMYDEIRKRDAEIERLQHDIERHIRITSAEATENERLRAALRKIEERTTDPVARSIAGEILVVLDHEQPAAPNG